MIPKTIHYCWFGRNPKPKLAEKCIKSWKRYCPDYEIIEWNEDNFDIASAPLYVRQAYEAKKWAFVTDYVRLQVVYEHGGIYLDTDVEVIKSLDRFLQHQAYFGLESDKYVATGLGFGAERGLPLLREMMEEYEQEPFLIDNGSYNEKTCPVRNTEILLKHGFVPDGKFQIIDGFAIYPSEYFCPIDLRTRANRQTKNTYSVHWFSASWWDKQQRRKHKKNTRKERIDLFFHTPHRIFRKVLGDQRYEMLKKRLKG